MRKAFAALVLTGLLLPGAAFAAAISIAATTRATVTNGMLELSIELRNTGGASAEDVTLLDNAGGALFSAPASLGPKEHIATVVTRQLPASLLPGSYTEIARVRYSDRGGGTASFAFVIPYVVPPVANDAPEPFAIAVEPLRFRQSGELSLIGAALDGAPRTVALTLVLPDELSYEAPSSWTAMPAGSVLRIPIVNKGARPGSRYPVTAIASFEADGRHHALTASSIIVIAATRGSRSWRPILSIAAGILLVMSFVTRYRPRWRPHNRLLDALLVGISTLVVAWHVCPPELLHDTTTVGGDLVAHHYIVSRLRESLLSQGRIIAWAPGWWGGFPLFQYYFPLPYLVILALDILLPYNLAFKIGAVLGLIVTPAAVWCCGRLARLPRPIPALLALLSVPLLLDTTHTMWGVNAYSTLAGMVANSYSFALLPPALGCALRDARRGRANPITALLFCAVIGSHFFTSLMLSLMLMLIPWMPGMRPKRALRALAPSGLLSLLICAGWLLPLIVRRPWSVDFGVNWTVYVWRNLPIALRLLGIPSLALLAALVTRRRLPRATHAFTVAMACFTAIGIALFRWGYDISPLFVNIRLWPFIVFGLLTLAGIAVGTAIRQFPYRFLPTLAFALLVLALAWDTPNHARSWARFNFRGLESMPDAMEVFVRLVDPLDGTPGRLSYDLHPDNERLGSSRVFEVVPHRIDKAILEGGLVNSALGSLTAYRIQGGISDASAGFPPIVRPGSFDPAAATLHLTWMNVSHFIARSPRTRKALEVSEHWRRIDAAGAWTLFASNAHDGSSVRVLFASPTPVLVESHTLQEDLLEWLYRPAAVAEPYLYLLPGMVPPLNGPAPIEREEYHRRLEALEEAPLPDPASLFTSKPIDSLEETPGLIRFRTTALHQPHLIATTWFPKWRASGAEGPYFVSPSLMLVYPESHEVELRYTDGLLDRVARTLSMLGVLTVAVWGLYLALPVFRGVFQFRGSPKPRK